MSEDEEMSDEELDSLISDLESRDGGSGELSGGGEVPEEEIDDFLKELEDEEGGGGEVETAVSEEPETDVGPDLSELEGADELPVEAEESAPAAEEVEEPSEEPKKSKKASQESSEDEKAEPSESEAWRYAWIGVKWTGFVLPVLSLWWLLGAYLGQWVSAGWLIFLMSAMFVFGLPKLAYDAADHRGRYRWWLAGMALVFTVALTAPISGIAGEVLAGYGHWPGTVLTEVFGTDLGIGRLTGALGEYLGTQFAPGISEAATQVDLGSTPAE